MRNSANCRSLLVLILLLSAGGASGQVEYIDTEKDWPGIKRDLAYLMGWQVVATAIIYNAPFEFSNWSQDEKDNLGFEQWRDNVTDPVWDEDHWAVNYVLHPYWGAGYYIRGRERGFSRAESVWVAVVFSSVYEFGVESFLEQPSIQDLIVTPLGGAAVGIYFEKVRGRIRSQPDPLSFGDKLVLGLTDPLGALNRNVNRLFNIEEFDEQRAVIGFRLLRESDGPNIFDHRPAIRSGSRDIDGLQLTFEYRW